MVSAQFNSIEDLADYIVTNYIEPELPESPCLCPECVITALNDLRTAILEQNAILEYLLVLTKKKQAGRDAQQHFNTIDLIRDLMSGGDDEDLCCGSTSQVD